MGDSNTAPSIPSGGQESAKKILILMNQNKETESFFEYVKKQGFEVKIVNQLQDMIKELPEFSPDFILLSWNFKNLDVKRAYKFFETHSKAICVVFGEEYSAKTSSGIASGGFTHTLLPPLSGRAIALRLSGLLKEQEQKKQKEEKWQKKAEESKLKMAWAEAFDDEPKSSSAASIKLPEEDEELPDLNWDLEEDSDNAEEKIWKSQQDKPTGEKKFYYFKGPTPENYKTQVQKGVKAGKVPLIMSERPVNKQELQIFKKAQSSVEFSLNQTGPEAREFSITQESPEKLESKLTRQSIIEKALRDSLSHWPEASPIDNSKSDGQIKINLHAHFTAFVVKTSRELGYVVLANSSGSPDLDRSKKLLEKFSEKLAEAGEPLLGDADQVEGVLEIFLTPMDFEQWARYKAEFYFQWKISDLVFEISFVRLEKWPAMKEAPNNLCCIPIQDFVEDSDLLFDIYILLPKNKRFILYLKKGSELSKSTLNRLESFGSKNLYILEKDKIMFLTYILKNLMSS